MVKADKLAVMRANLKEQFSPQKYLTFWDVFLNPIGVRIQRSARAPSLPPFWVNLLVLELFFLLCDQVVSTVMREYHDLRLELIPIELFLVAISFIFIVCYKIHSDRLLEDCRSYLIDNLCSETSLIKLGRLGALNASKKGPWMVGLAFGLFWFFLGPYLVYATKGGFLGWGPWLLVVLVNFVIGTGAYYLYLLLAFRIQLGSYDFNLYGPNPSQSTVIVRLSELLFMPVLQVMLLSTLTTLAFSVTGLFSVPGIGVSVLFGWIPMSTIFALNHLALAKIIKRAKRNKLAEIESMIAEVDTKEGLASKDDIEKLLKLSDYHDRIFDSPNSKINFRSVFTFTNTLLLPLASFVLANLGTLLKLLP